MIQYISRSLIRLLNSPGPSPDPRGAPFPPSGCGVPTDNRSWDTPQTAFNLLNMARVDWVLFWFLHQNATVPQHRLAKSECFIPPILFLPITLVIPGKRWILVWQALFSVSLCELALIPFFSPKFAYGSLWRGLPRADARPFQCLIQPNKHWWTGDFLWCIHPTSNTTHSLTRAVIIPCTLTEVAAPSLRFAAHTLSSALGFPYQLSTASHFSFIIISFHFLKLYMVFLFFTVVFTSLTSQSCLFF